MEASAKHQAVSRPDDGGKGYAQNVPVTPLPVPPIERAFRLLFPYQNSPRPGSTPYPGFIAGVLALFRGACQWGTIQHWRYARHAPPQWVKDTVAEHLRRDAYEKLAVADLLQPKEKAPD